MKLFALNPIKRKVYKEYIPLFVMEIKQKPDTCDFCGKAKMLMGSWINWELGEEYNYCSQCLGEIKK